MKRLSIIICTHNPITKYLKRTLEALRLQQLEKLEWELLVVDNASDQKLQGQINLDWHPSGRIVEEPEAGLTPARLRGIREAQADLLIFVDDDNVLFPDYLSEAIRLAEQHRMLGAWGGQIFPEYEKEPPASMTDFVPYLALREITKARWTNYDPSMTCCPFGAGICVRADVAKRYAEKIRSLPIFRTMDRRKDSLMGGGDVDLAMTSYQLGLGIGVFPELKLTHLISEGRVDPGYLYKLVAAGNYSGRLVHLLNDEHAIKTRQSRFRRKVKTSLPALKMFRWLGKLDKEPLYYQAATIGVCQAEEDFVRIKTGTEPLGISHLYTR